MIEDVIVKAEKILERKLSDEEQKRFLRIKRILKVADDDAIWDLLIAMEYQRLYYERFPQLMEDKAVAVLADMKAETERRADTIIEGFHVKKWFAWATALVAFLIFYGSLSMWAGYAMGLAKILPPSQVFAMPAGVVMGLGLLSGGIFLGVQAVSNLSDVNQTMRKYVVPAFACLLSALAIMFLTLGL